MDKFNPMMLEVPTELTTARLNLRVPKAGDGSMIFNSVRASLAELKPWMPWATDDYGEKDAEAWARRAAVKSLERERLEFLIFNREGNRHLGTIGLFDFHWPVPRGEIGYWLRTSDTRNGYMTEAVAAIIELGKSLKLRRIQIRANAENRRSCRVAERAGFTLDGILRDYDRSPDGSLSNQSVYSRLFDPPASSEISPPREKLTTHV